MHFAFRSGASIALAAAPLIFTGAALAPSSYAGETRVFAQEDTMGKDTMGKDTMGKDTMSKDTMGKDTMSKDTMAKDSMNKDEMEK
jgi:pentapeptide MXKDX repeat protein